MCKISIVTPSYNQGLFIEKTIQSVVQQSYSLKEYLVIDGASTDETTDVLNRYNRQIDHWVSETDNGQSHAINKGLKRATGEVFNWINSDDFLEPNALDHISAAFSDSSVNVFCGIANIVDFDGNIIRRSQGTDIYYENPSRTIGYARIDQPETWWRKSVLDEIGPLNEKLHYTMDRDWWIKYLLHFGLSGIKKDQAVLANFRIHDKSKTSSEKAAFDFERNAYYRSLAIEYNMNDTANQLRNLIGAEKIEHTDLPQQPDLNLLNDAFQYFYLLLAEEAYVRGDHEKLKRILNVILPEALSEEDQHLMEKLRFRAKLPKSFIHFVRKLRN